MLNSHLPKLYLVTGTLLAAFEMILSPHPFMAKQGGYFPAVAVGSFMFTVTELFVITGIIFFLGTLFASKALSPKHLTLSFSPYRSFNILILIFVFSLLVAIFLGGIFRNAEYANMVRVQFFLLNFFVIYRQKEWVFAYRKFIFRVINIVGILFAVLVIATYFYPAMPIPGVMPSSDLYIRSLGYGLFMTIFTATYYFNKILFYRWSFASFWIVLIALFSVFLRIGGKPIVLAAFVSFCATTFVMLFVYKRGTLKAFLLSLVFIVVSSLVLSSATIRGHVFSTFSKRFYKIELSPEVAGNMDFLDVLLLAKNTRVTGAGDISAGRFDLWAGYIKLASSSPIVSINFGTRPTIETSAAGKVEFAAHNSIVHYIYYSGFPAGIALFLLIVLFIVKGQKAMKKPWWPQGTLLPFQMSTLYAFIISIIAVEMIGGPIQSTVRFTWFFWCLVTIFFYQILLFKHQNLPHISKQCQVQSVLIQPTVQQN